MKLIVFTPANTKSAIGRMAALVTRELVAQGSEVTVVRTEVKHLLSTDVHDFGTRILPWDDDAEVRALIQSADAGVYQIGNNFQFHEGGVRWLAEFPGLVCLHDFFLGHLFYGWAQMHRAQAQAALQFWYGEEMAERFFSYCNTNSFIEATHEVMPMVEWICSQADGVVTHSSWGCERVMNSCSGPIRVVPLAWSLPAEISDTAKNMVDDPRTLQLLTIGHVNSNKRVTSVIRAIGLSPLLKERVNYRLIGAVTPETKNSLTALANSLGVNLVISGEVDGAELAQGIKESDVISCLRWPTLEAASASAIEGMLYGKAVIVTNTGFYADIPELCVIKINQSNEIPEIQSSLEGLLENKTRAKSLGEEAKQWAARTFTSRNYATQLIEIIEQISRTLPAKRAAENIADFLSQWSEESKHITPDLIKTLRIFEKTS